MSLKNPPLLSTPLPNIITPQLLYKSLTQHTQTNFSQLLFDGLKIDQLYLNPQRLSEQDWNLLSFLLANLKYPLIQLISPKLFKPVVDLYQSIHNGIQQGLQSLYIENVTFTSQGIQIISTNIPNDLKEINLISCGINDKLMRILSQGLQYSQVILINLKGNLIQEGESVGKICSVHGEKRDQDCQQGREVMGVCEVNLENNQIDDKGVRELLWFIQQDRWMRNLNLKGNKLTSRGFEFIRDCMDLNRNLISFDIRQNLETDVKFQINLTKSLIRNLKLVKNTKIDKKVESEMNNNENQEVYRQLDNKQFKKEIYIEILNQSGLSKEELEEILNCELTKIYKKQQYSKKKKMFQKKIDEFQQFIYQYLQIQPNREQRTKF